MITGDSIDTAISVGYKCGIVDTSQKIWLGVSKNDKVTWRQTEHFDYDTISKNSEISSLESSTVSKIAKIKKKNKFLNKKVHKIVQECIDGDIKIALDGNSYEVVRKLISTDLLKEMLEFTLIFARTKPSQKSMIVKDLKKIYYP